MHFTRIITLCLWLLAPWLLAAQETQAPGALTGKVTDASGAVVPNATVTVTNVATSQPRTASTGTDGAYQFTQLPPGNYSVKFEAAGFKTVEIPSATINAAQSGILDAKLDTEAPTLGDLGLSPNAAQGNAVDQALLDRRSHMLKIHQRLGLITTLPLLATLITSSDAGGKHGSVSSRDWHAALGGVTLGMYFTAASFAIRAPRVPGTTTRGPIRLHKALAWIHGTGMVLTPVLGVMAFNQLNNGEKVHGIAQAHGAVAWITSAAYAAAMVSVSFKF